MVPKDLRGTKLIPLNNLKECHPDLYEKYRKKYFDHPDRPVLLKKQIPKLDCLWNDVLHFLPLHPHHVYKALTSLGIKVKAEQQYFRIPIEKVKENKNAIYLYSKENYRGPAETIIETEIEILNVEEYRTLKDIPSDTVEYYRIEKEKGNRFGLFSHIPHLLSHGEVDINDVEIITWNQSEKEEEHLLS